MRQGFFTDNSAISPIIGTALVLAILVSTLGFVQQHYVPVWNTEVEVDHFEQVYADLTRFTSTVSSVAATGTPMTSDINMGLRFPSRGIFFNPKAMVFGRLITDRLNVTVNYTTTNGTQTKHYNSSTVIYELDGVAPHPKLVYEYGILIRDSSAYGRPNFTSATGDPFISGNDIYVPVLMANITTRKDEISITPIQKNIFPSPSERVADLSSSTVTITLGTNYPDVWRKLIQTDKIDNIDINIAPDNKHIVITSAIVTQLNLPKNQSDMLMQSDRLYSGQIYMGFTS